MKNSVRQRYHLISPWPIVLLALVLSFSCPGGRSVHAESWSFFWEYDALVGTDQHYTNGIGVSWMSGELCSNNLDDFEQSYGKAMKNLIDSVPLVELGPCHQMAGIKIAQVMVTPEDTRRRDLIKDDLPYAGYLSYTFFLNEWNQDYISQYHFSFGLVGPSSGAEITQTLYHKLIGNSIPRGWKHQLEDEWMVGIGYYVSRNHWEKPIDGSGTVNLSTSIGWDIGNFYTGATLGVMFRYGHNFPKNGVFADGFSLGGIGSEFVNAGKTRRYGWSFNLGTYLSAAATVHFIDSAEDQEIDRHPLSLSHVAGMSFYMNRVQITFALSRVAVVVNNYFTVNGWGGLKLTRLF